TGKERPFVMPKDCPVCGQSLSRPEGEVVFRCVNVDCPAQALGRDVHFASRGAMDIEHLGDKRAAPLIVPELISDPAAVFVLSAHDLGTLPGFKEKSIRNLLEAIAQAKNRPLSRLVFALGIRHVGSTVAERLAIAFPSLDALAKASAEEIAAVPGVG